jgi:hypothetical protein
MHMQARLRETHNTDHTFHSNIWKIVIISFAYLILTSILQCGGQINRFFVQVETQRLVSNIVFKYKSPSCGVAARDVARNC